MNYKNNFTRAQKAPALAILCKHHDRSEVI